MTRVDAEGQMILLSAGTAARREATYEQAEQLGATLDWSRLVELLSVRRLLPTLGPRILELAGEQAGEDFASAVARAVELGRRQGALQQLIVTRVAEALADAGIRSAALKGPVLSEALYGDPGRRLSSDLDLLVAEAQLYGAVDVVRGLGYAAPTDYVEEDGLPLLHFALCHQREELPPVELHWRIHWYETSFARERLLAPEDDLSGGWRPAPVDELIALLLFYARDGFIGLRHAADLGAWWDVHGATLHPGALDEPLRAYPALEPVLLAAVKVADRTVGLPAGQLTKRGARLGGRARIAVRLAEPYPHSSQAQLFADMGLIDGLLAPPGDFRAFLRRQVRPPREVVRERARSAEGRQVRSTLGYSVRMLVRYALAMTRLWRAPEAAG